MYESGDAKKRWMLDRVVLAPTEPDEYSTGLERRATGGPARAGPGGSGRLAQLRAGAAGAPAAAGAGATPARAEVNPTLFSIVSNVALSIDLAYASSGATSFFVTRSIRASFNVTMPTALPTCIMDWTWNVLLSRIRLLMADVTIRTSSAAARPPPIFLHSVCEMTPFNDSDSITRICAWRSAGN